MVEGDGFVGTIYHAACYDGSKCKYLDNCCIGTFIEFVDEETAASFRLPYSIINVEFPTDCDITFIPKHIDPDSGMLSVCCSGTYKESDILKKEKFLLHRLEPSERWREPGRHGRREFHASSSNGHHRSPSTVRHTNRGPRAVPRARYRDLAFSEEEFGHGRDGIASSPTPRNIRGKSRRNRSRESPRMSPPDKPEDESAYYKVRKPKTYYQEGPSHAYRTNESPSHHRRPSVSVPDPSWRLPRASTSPQSVRRPSHSAVYDEGPTYDAYSGRRRTSWGPGYTGPRHP